MVSFFKREPFRDRDHLDFVTRLICVNCGNAPYPRNDPAHQRAGLPQDKRGGGSQKSDDDCVNPLCRKCHDLQGRIGEKTFWARWGGLDKSFALTQEIYLLTGQEEKANEAVRRFRRVLFN